MSQQSTTRVLTYILVFLLGVALALGGYFGFTLLTKSDEPSSVGKNPPTSTQRAPQPKETTSSAQQAPPESPQQEKKAREKAQEYGFVQEFCLDESGACFYYPAGYSVNIAPPGEAGDYFPGAHDKAELVDAQGVGLLVMYDRIDASQRHCDPAAQVFPYETVDIEPTGMVGDDGRPIYILRIIASWLGQSEEVNPHLADIELTQDDRLLDPAFIDWTCDMQDSNLVRLGNSTLAISMANNTTYSNFDDARYSYYDPRYDVAHHILETLHTTHESSMSSKHPIEFRGGEYR